MGAHCSSEKHVQVELDTEKLVRNRGETIGNLNNESFFEFYTPGTAVNKLTTDVSCFSMDMLAKLCKQRQNNRIIVSSKCDDAEWIESHSININTTHLKTSATDASLIGGSKARGDRDD